MSTASGSSDEKIAAIAIWRENTLFSPAERAAFAFAEGMKETPAMVVNEVFAEARGHFREVQFVKRAATAAMENYCARLNRAFLVDSQGLYRPDP